MEFDYQVIIDASTQLLRNFYYSPFMLVVKIFIGLYLAVLFVDIVLLLILRDVPSHLRTGIKGADMPMTTKRKMERRWKKVKSRLKGNNAAQFKIAIIEADAIAEEVLGGIGYKGANMTERLEQVGTAHLDDHLEALKGVHEIRNRVVHEADFAVDQRMAESVIGVYENFLKYLYFL